MTKSSERTSSPKISGRTPRSETDKAAKTPKTTQKKKAPSSSSPSPSLSPQNAPQKQAKKGQRTPTRTPSRAPSMSPSISAKRAPRTPSMSPAISSIRRLSEEGGAPRRLSLGSTAMRTFTAAGPDGTRGFAAGRGKRDPESLATTCCPSPRSRANSAEVASKRLILHHMLSRGVFADAEGDEVDSVTKEAATADIAIIEPADEEAVAAEAPALSLSAPAFNIEAPAFAPVSIPIPAPKFKMVEAAPLKPQRTTDCRCTTLDCDGPVGNGCSYLMCRKCCAHAAFEPGCQCKQHKADREQQHGRSAHLRGRRVRHLYQGGDYNTPIACF